jgi:hypothetical protein
MKNMENHKTKLEERSCLRSKLGALLSCPVCGGKAVYCDDGQHNRRVDCCGDGVNERDGCGLGVWNMNSFVQARVIWNMIPRVR